MSRMLAQKMPVRRARVAGAVVAGVLAAWLLPGAGQGQPGVEPALLTAELLPPLVESVDLLINGFGANAVYYRVGSDGVEADCDVFSEGRRTSYDYRCAIPVAALTAGPQTVVIERERYGRPLGSVAIELAVGGS